MFDLDDFTWVAMRSTADELAKVDGESVFPPHTMPWGQRTCYISDPEGNLIEITLLHRSVKTILDI